MSVLVVVLITITDPVESDGATPAEQIEQILAVTPILPGQKPSEKFAIPPQQHKKVDSTPAQAQVPVQAPIHDDLIDVGPPSTSTPAPASHLPDDMKAAHGPPSTSTPAPASHLPDDLKAAQTQNGGQQQLAMEQSIRETSTDRKNEDALIDFHGDLQKSLPKAEPSLLRQDTDTQSVDEFVDAQG